MKLTIITFVSVLASSVNAYGVPDCAGDCINNYGGCNAYDYKCICNDATFIDNLACCVSKSCNQKNQELTIEFAQKLCKPYGASNIPTAATCAATATGASTTVVTTSASGTVTSTVTTNAQSSTPASSSTTATSTPGSGAGQSHVIEKLGIGMAVAGLVAAL